MRGRKADGNQVGAGQHHDHVAADVFQRGRPDDGAATLESGFANGAELFVWNPDIGPLDRTEPHVRVETRELLVPELDGLADVDYARVGGGTDDGDRPVAGSRAGAHR